MNSSGKKNNRKPTECFRSVSELFETDNRNIDAPTIFAGQPQSIEEYHRWIAEYDLPSKCPDDIRTQYDLARNLYAYAWYVYRFTSPAQAQAYAALELALRTRLIELGIVISKRSGLFALLTKAVENRLLRDGGFPHLRYFPGANSIDPDGTEFCERLPRMLSGLRNSFAHGDTTLLNLPVSLMALESTCSIIHQLYGRTGPSAKIRRNTRTRKKRRG